MFSPCEYLGIKSILKYCKELFIIVLLAFAYGVYGLSWVLNGRNVRPLPSRYPSVPLSEDFGTVLLNTGLTVLKTTRSIGLLTEMDPIHLPLAVGLSPAVSAQLAQKARRRFSDETPLNRNLDQEALRQSSSSRQQLANSGVLVDVLWRQWALLFMYLFTALELCVMFTIRILTGFRFRPRAVPSSQQTRLPSSTINPLFFDSELEESLDPDYVPGEGDDDLVSEQTTSSDSSDLEEEEDSDDDQRTLNENVPQRGEEDIYQELFDLARDIHENDGEASPSFDPLPRFLAWMSASPSGSKRYWTRSSSVSAIGEGLPISPQRNSFALTSLPTFGETRLCVICQAEKRSIVLRPCGCLCLCDEGCRQSLAARKFRDCPCCRREILGYSKIFEP